MSPSSVPFIIAQAPVKVCVKFPNASLPPDPFIVNPVPFTVPINVAVFPLFDIVTVPVVVKPAILCVFPPLMVTSRLLKFSTPVPVLAKFPCITKFPEEAAVVPLPEKVRF